MELPFSCVKWNNQETKWIPDCLQPAPTRAVLDDDAARSVEVSMDVQVTYRGQHVWDLLTIKTKNYIETLE